MPPRLLFIALFLGATAMADEVTSHRFDLHGAHQAEGLPEPIATVLVIAGKPVTLHFSGLPADWDPSVDIHRVNSTRMLKLEPVETELAGEVWQLTWTPPETLGPARYLIRLKGQPNRIVRIETRDSKWIDATRAALANAEWEAQGLTAEERSALGALGIQTGRAASRGKQAAASLEMRPRQSDAARRRVVWDEENPTLLVWRPGPAAGDLEARAPRWWISPKALATDHGLIRFLDLISEPPLKP